MRETLPSGTVTFLFTDIEGSTQLLQRLGERYVSVLAMQRKILRRAFQKFHGREVDTQGDSFFVAFARAADAISASVMAQRALAAHDWREDERVRVRMGLHTGAPQLTIAGYVGLDVHIAARLCAAAHGGQVLLSQQTRDLVEQLPLDAVGVRDLGEHRLKDLDRPRHIFQLVISNLLANGVRNEFPPLRTLDALPHNLPIQLTSFIGREYELAEIKQLLTTTRLLTLTGTGGAGKTRLALQAAADLVESYADGVWFVELAPLSDPALVAGTVAAVLGVVEQPGQPILNSLIDYLRAQDILLLLDNCEHLIEACAHFADSLLRACPHLRVLATSREALGIAGETTWIVPSLSLPDAQQPRPTFADLSQYEAVQLFTARAAAVQPVFKLTELNAASVTQICQRLDGIPLAIELAAARVRVLQTAEIAARLDDRFRLLATGSRTALPRQQTLRGAIDWSYDLLDEPERVLLRRLSVFAGGWTLDAAEAVTNVEGGRMKDEKESSGFILLPSSLILDILSRLVDKSLVIVDQQKGETRYGMLETIREYAFEKLKESREVETLRLSHQKFFLSLAQRLATSTGSQLDLYFNELEQEHDNLRAALRRTLEQHESEFALALCNALAVFWEERGYWTEGRSWFEQAIAVSRQDQAAAPVSQTHLAQYGKALNESGTLAVDQGDHATAHARLNEALAVERELGEKRGIASVLGNFGVLAWQQDNPEQARSYFQESLALWRELGDKLEIAYTLSSLGLLAKEQGEYNIAHTLSQESLACFRELGNKRGIAFALYRLGWLAMIDGDYATSQQFAEESFAVHQELDDKHRLAWSLNQKGFLAWHQGNYIAARSSLEQAIAIFQKLQASSYNVCLCLTGLAIVDMTEGHFLRGTKLLGAIKAESERTGRQNKDIFLRVYNQALDLARAQLNAGSLDAAWEEGRALTMEQAIAYALEMPVTPEIQVPQLETRQATKKIFYGLTARERQVAERVAQGESNREIAGALVVSERTVETHVTNILNKLGFTSRAEIRKWAIEKGLVSHAKRD